MNWVTVEPDVQCFLIDVYGFFNWQNELFKNHGGYCSTAYGKGRVLRDKRNDQTVVATASLLINKRGFT